MPLLSTPNQDTLDVPDFDDDRCQSRYHVGAVVRGSIHGNTRYDSDSNHNLHRRFAQQQFHSEEISVITNDSAPQSANFPTNKENTAPSHENRNSSDGKRVHSTKNGEDHQQTLEETGFGARSSVSISSWIPSRSIPAEGTMPCVESLVRQSHHQIPEIIKPMTKYSTQIYSGTPSTPSTQASSQSDKCMEDLSLRADEHTPSVFNDDFEPEQQIIKLSVDLATSQQDLDHSKLQARQYRTEVSRLQSLVEKLMEENIELKYSMVDMEKRLLIEKINETPMIMPITKPANFETPIKANPRNMTPDTADDGNVINPINSSLESDEMSCDSHITCHDLYTSNTCNDTIQEEVEYETNIGKDGHKISKIKPIYLFNDKEIDLQDGIYTVESFETRRENNNMEHISDEKQVLAPTSTNKASIWGAFQWKRKKSPEISLDKFITKKPTASFGGKNRMTRLFSFRAASQDDGVCDETVIQSISSLSTAPKQKLC